MLFQILVIQFLKFLLKETLLISKHKIIINSVTDVLFLKDINIDSGSHRSRCGYRYQFSSVAQSRLTLCDPIDCSTPGLSVHHQLLGLAQTHFHQVSDDIQPSHPLPSPSHPAFNPSQPQSLFQWVSSSHHVAKLLEFQLQHQSFQWIFRTDIL